MVVGREPRTGTAGAADGVKTHAGGSPGQGQQERIQVRTEVHQQEGGAQDLDREGLWIRSGGSSLKVCVGGAAAPSPEALPPTSPLPPQDPVCCSLLFAPSHRHSPLWLIKSDSLRLVLRWVWALWGATE